MQDGGKILIDVTNIEQSFKVGEETIKVLHPASLQILSNSFNIIYGPSGSGKSTMLNVLSGIQKPSAGTVKFWGKDIYQYSPDQLAYFRAKEIGVVYQSNYWVHSFNVIENVSVPLYFLGYTRSQAHRLAMDALQRVDMATFAKKSPLMLSGGEQQRIAIARAIVADPTFIIADEPTGSLDTKNGDMVMTLLNSYNRDLGRTIILVSHNMEYLPLADQLVSIQDGHAMPMAADDVSKTTKTLVEDLKKRLKLVGGLKHG